jgi:hypothetical protein
MSQKKVPNKGGRPPKHGARMLGRLLRDNKIDQRLQVARLLKIQRDLLVDDAGGLANISNRELLLIEKTATLAVIMSAMENWAFKEKPINPEGALLNVLAQNYIGYSNALRNNLTALGLKPTKPSSDIDLQDYLKQQQAQEAPE